MKSTFGAVVALSLFAGCGGSDDSGGGSVDSSRAGSTAPSDTGGEAASSGGTLRVAFNDGGVGETLNPLRLPTFVETARAQQIYDRLFQQQADRSMAPVLAESLEANDDATVWTLKLKEGVTFHDGKPFTADDVLWTLNLIADPDSASESLSNIEPIDLEATKKVSNTEIEFHLKRPIGDFATLLGSKSLLIVPDGQSEFTAETANGTGPFKLEEFVVGERTVLSANEDYHAGRPHVDTLEMIQIPDNTARLNALQGGQVDAMVFLEYPQAKALENDDSVQLIRGPGSAAVPFTMRIDEAPFDDPKVREAFKLSVDREQMVDNVLLGFGRVGNDVFGEGYPSYNQSLEQREYDPERAKELLAEAGYPDGLTVTLYTSDAGPGMKASATALKEQASAAGIEIQLETLDTAAYFSNDLYLSAPLYQSYWSSSFESVTQDGLLPDSPYNETGWPPEGSDWADRFREAQGIADDDERNALYGQLQQELWADGGYIIWGFADLVDAVSPQVTGVTPNGVFPLGYFNFKDWSIES